MLDDLYFAVADVLLSVNQKKSSVRSAVYEHPFEDKRKLLRLSCETIKFATLFDDLLKNQAIHKVLINEAAYGSRVFLLHVLLYDFLIGNGINRASTQLRKPIQSLKNDIHETEKRLAIQGKGIQQLKDSLEKKQRKVEIPRYARINELKWNKEEALDTLEKEGWKFIDSRAACSFQQQVHDLKDDQILIDPHVPELLVFSNLAKMHGYWMTEQRYLILQDKASCLPVFLLSPPVGSQCVDTCAAPGNKTSHLAAYVKENGHVWAFDRDATRTQTMSRLLKESGAKDIVTVECADFLRVNTDGDGWEKVEYAVVDPPCSGSGMVKRLDEWTGASVEYDRLSKLANLQAMLLKHTLKLPGLKRLVYSTCSIHEEENEIVVQEVLKEFNFEWRLVEDLLPEWELRGKETYEFGQHCLRADPEVTLTNGFFVAVFERVLADGRKKKKAAKKRKLAEIVT